MNKIIIFISSLLRIIRYRFDSYRNYSFIFEEINEADWGTILLCTDSLGDYLHKLIQEGDVGGSSIFIDAISGEGYWGGLRDAMLLAEHKGGIKEDDVSIFLMRRDAE